MRTRVLLTSSPSYFQIVNTHTGWQRPIGWMPYVNRSFSAKEPYNHWLFCGKGPALSIKISSKFGEIPYLRLRSHQELWSRSWHGWFLEQSFWFRRCSITPLYSKSISCCQGESKRGEARRVLFEWKHVCHGRSCTVSLQCLACRSVCLWR